MGVSLRNAQMSVEELTPIRSAGSKNYDLPREALPLFLVPPKQIEHDKAMKEARLKTEQHKGEYSSSELLRMK